MAKVRSMDKPQGAGAGPIFLDGAGGMAARMRAHDWTGFHAGEPGAWPCHLAAAVGLMLGSLSPMFVGLGPDLALVYNDAYARLLGDRDATALGRPYREVWPDLWPALSELATRTLAGEAITAEDLWFSVDRGGVPTPTAYSFSASPLRDGAGDVAGVFCVCAETTEKASGRNALAANEARLRGVLEGMGEGFCLIDRDFRIVQVNAAGLRLDGRRRDEVVGRLLWDVYPSAADDALRGLYREAMRAGTPFSAEVAQGLPDGRRAWLELRAYPSDEGLAVFYRDVTHRREREDALVEAETRLRALADNLPGGVAFQVVAPPDNSWRRFVYFSAGFEDLFGFPVERALADANAVYGMIPEQYRAAVAEAEARNVREMRPFDGVVPWTRPDGTIVYGRILSAPRRLPDGNLIFDGIMLDETARQVAEARLREGEARFQAIVDTIEQAVWSMDGEDRFDFFNQRWRDWSGLPDGPVDWPGLLALCHPDDRAEAAAGWERAKAGDDGHRGEFRLRDAAGRHRWVHVRARSLRAPDGTILRWFGTFTDVHETVVAREVLSRSREVLEREVAERTQELDRVWRLSRDMLAVCGPDGLTRSNPAWEGVLGHPAAGLVGAGLVDLVHPDDRAKVDEAVRSNRVGQAASGILVRMPARDGAERWVDWTLVPGDGVVYASGRDVTDQHATEEALRQAQKMEAVGQLTGGLAHDFNNLLTGIVGSLEMMQNRIAQGRHDAIPRYVTAAMSSANRAAALTHRLLAFARRQPLDPKAVDVNRLVASLEDLVRRTIGEMTALEIRTETGVWPTLCDPHQLESAVLNLCINARDAMPDGGRIAIRTENMHVDEAFARRHPGIETGPYVCVRVEDTGCGMSPNVLARAFDPFFTTKPLGQGTGLGLSMIYGFARQSGGHAVIESEPGAGTSVRILLPPHRGDASAEEVGTPGLTEAMRALPGETVLVVEDEDVVRGLVTEVLSDLGYRAIEAADGPSGLRILQRPGRIDLLVTDVGLPGLNGRQVADQARVGRPDLKVLFITGYAENATFGKALEGPDTQLITKPFTVEALAGRIRAMIGG